MKFIIKLLASFNYKSVAEFSQSLMPTSKYQLTAVASFFSVLFPVIDRVFGLDAYAFIALLCCFIAEVGSGIVASIVSKVPIESFKASRFSVKTTCYMLLIALPHVMSVNFEAKGYTMITTVFDWLYLFFLCHIVWELAISILENLAVINGKDKTYWISKLQDKLNGLLT